MAHGHPAEFYVRYLMVILEDPSQEVINKQLELYNIAPVLNDQFSQIAQAVGEPPPGLKLHDRKHRLTTAWLKSLRIYSLVHRDDVVQSAFRDILHSRPTRSVVERLLLGRVTPMEASYRMRELKLRIEDRVIAEFGHYFWNTETLGVPDWAAYLARAQTISNLQGAEEFYVSALYGGPEIAMYRAGISVEVNNKALLEEVHDELAMTFRQVRSLPLSQEKVMMLRGLTRSIIHVQTQLAASDSALQDVLKRFEKFKVSADDSPLPTLIDLAPTGTVSDKTREDIMRNRRKQ